MAKISIVKRNRVVGILQAVLSSRAVERALNLCHSTRTFCYNCIPATCLLAELYALLPAMLVIHSKTHQPDLNTAHMLLSDMNIFIQQYMCLHVHCKEFIK